MTAIAATCRGCKTLRRHRLIGREKSSGKAVLECASCLSIATADFVPAYQPELDLIAARLELEATSRIMRRR